MTLMSFVGFLGFVLPSSRLWKTKGFFERRRSWLSEVVGSALVHGIWGCPPCVQYWFNNIFWDSQCSLVIINNSYYCVKKSLSWDA